MHSTAVSTLISAQHAAASIGASLRVVNPSPFAARLLHATGVATAPEHRPLERQPVGV